MSISTTLARAKNLREGQEVLVDDRVQTVHHVRRHITRDDVLFVSMLTLGGAPIVIEMGPEELVEVIER